MTKLSLLLALVAIQVPAILAGIPEAIFKATTLEELEAFSNPVRSEQELLRGRRRMQDGTLETSQHVLADSFGGEPGFYHSVASGDPLPDAVILWTRYTPALEDDEITLEFRIAEIGAEMNADLLDPTKNSAVKRGSVKVTAAADFVVKIDVTGLPANSHFAYVFSDGSKVSDIGMTRTAPNVDDEVTELTYAFFSCSHFANGYFHAYDVGSTIADLDVWMHIGDYYYEYGLYGSYARDAQDRSQYILPVWETIDLQDYRNRHASYVAHDEGLRNLRRRAPVIATWDDHEMANDGWGNVNQGTGAENHQPVCPANVSSSDADKDAAGCDRDEGDAVERFSAAAQAYWEWMPIRYNPGTKAGELQSGSITQIIEWGTLATIASFDTRMSYRTKESTGQNAFPTFAPVAVSQNDTSAYLDTNSSAYALLQSLAESNHELRSNESYAMFGDYLDTMQQVFSDSKEAGKPWQILAANTMMGHYVLPDPAQLYLDAPSDAQAAVQAFFQEFLPSDSALTFRIIAAMAAADIEWNLDDMGGFYVERAKILEIAKTYCNNMVVLGGDLHDAFAWVMPEGGMVEGDPVAVNLGCTGVTSPGFKGLLLPVLAPILDSIGGVDGAVNMINGGYMRANPNLKFADIGHKGFVAVKVTPTTHTAEFIGISPEDILRNYSAARELSGSITSNFTCLKSLITQADQPGSLEPQDSCSAISFDTTRPAVYDLAVVAMMVSEGDALTACGMEGCTFDASSPPAPSPNSAPVASAACKSSFHLFALLLAVIFFV